MKPHRILKAFNGTQDGEHVHQRFEANTVASLSPGLAAIVVKEGWAAEHIEHATPVAESRETKVVEPSEIKEDSEVKKPGKREKKA